MNCQSFNMSGGRENSISVLELINIGCQILDKSDKSVANSMRKADKLVCYLDYTKAKSIFRWKPKMSRLEGIKKQLEWLSQNCE